MPSVQSALKIQLVPKWHYGIKSPWMKVKTHIASSKAFDSLIILPQVLKLSPCLSQNTSAPVGGYSTSKWTPQSSPPRSTSLPVLAVVYQMSLQRKNITLNFVSAEKCAGDINQGCHFPERYPANHQFAWSNLLVAFLTLTGWSDEYREVCQSPCQSLR